MPSAYRNVNIMQCAMFAILLNIGSQAISAEEVNPYAKNYKAQNSTQLKSMQAVPDTQIFVSNHKEQDNISMLENGYDMMGSSGFEGGNVPAELALQHGKNIKADTVLVYSKYGSSKTAVSKMQEIKDALRKKGEVTEQDLTPDSTVYQYYASYWAKLPTPLLGVHIIKLKQKVDPRQSSEINQEETGLKVIAVINDSPAAKAGITKGDVLIKIGDVKMNKSDDLFDAVKRYEGQAVPVLLERDATLITTQAMINKRN